jgi:hypothetical protein
LIPFMGDLEAEAKEFSSKLKPARKPTPATKKPTPGAKKPTPAQKPTPATGNKASGSKKFPPIKLQTPGTVAARKNSQGMSDFGLVLKNVGDSFVVSQIANGGNAAQAGIRRGDVVTAIGGAELLAIEEFGAIEDAMTGGDRVEFEVSRRGGKPEKLMVQYGQPTDPSDEDLELAPAIKPSGSTSRNSNSAGTGLRSVFEGAQKPSSILKPTPANRVEPLELDLPALGGGK